MLPASRTPLLAERAPVVALARARAVPLAAYTPGILYLLLVGFLGVTTGLIIGRWWLLLLVPPAVYIWMFYFEWSILEEDIQRGLSLVYGAASAVGVVAGLLLRRFANRFVKPS